MSWAWYARHSIISLVMLLVILGPFVRSQTGEPRAQSREPTPSVTQSLSSTGPVPSSGVVERATLDNGLRVVIVRHTLAPAATIVMNYLAGSDEAPPGFPGTAHTQEHMMFRGSPGLTAGQLADLVAAMGGKFNADTQQMVTQYFFTVPAEDLDVALDVLAEQFERGVQLLADNELRRA